MHIKSFFLVLCFLLWQDIVSNQVSNSAATLENVNVNLTFEIPRDVQEEITVIKLDRGDGSRSQNVLFIYKSDFSTKVEATYTNRLTVTTSASERKVEIAISGVQSRDAGMYQCWNGTGITESLITNCSQKLIVVRKPMPRSIQPLTSALEGQTLKLSCNTSSRSLPADHGLSSYILWQDELNVTIGRPGDKKYVVNAEGQLEILNLEYSDMGRQVTCTSSDRAEGVATPPVSDPSPPYEIRIQGKPSAMNIILTPPLETKIIRIELESLDYTCTANCEPRCTVKWSFKRQGHLIFSPLQLSESHILNLKVTQKDRGTYRCNATNKHGEASREFNLEVYYLNTPVLIVNQTMEDRSIVVMEEDLISLTCLVDAFPAPHIRWNSPIAKELSTKKDYFPAASSGEVLHNIYSTTFSMSSIKVEDSGMYSCEVNNSVSSVKEHINISVLGPPSLANIPGLKLTPAYFRDFSHNVSLNVSFVIKSFPEPSVVAVTSTGNNSESSQNEDMASDVSITKVPKYKGKDYLTQFTFSVIRVIDINDKDRTFTLTFNNSKFSRDFRFILMDIGPPKAATNISTPDIQHDSVQLMWRPGPNWGLKQYFGVEFRCLDNTQCNSTWMTAIPNVPEQATNGPWTKVSITNLKPGTDYEFRILSINSRGSVTSEPFQRRTAEMAIITELPQKEETEELNYGIIAGIIAAAVAIIFITIVIYVAAHKTNCASRKKDGTRSTYVNVGGLALRDSRKGLSQGDTLQTNAHTSDLPKVNIEQLKSLYKLSNDSPEKDKATPESASTEIVVTTL
ncbi:hemicentin-1-like isoform X3 [Biomphalaria glabrata]|nr:hemicentin-1-like isoform X3 [Biomphalaria glabrata]XP_055867043.1 hemicentin-1-like isoform X3 [Biomphalaria glabrata]XP_055867044.1 hemicentin-1-like isoform X3 [Biomphalaria glabrata]